MARFAIVLVVGLVLGACSPDDTDPSGVEEAYGAPVDATVAIPAPAVAAEPARYVGRSVTVDGRVASVAQAGCTLYLHAGDGPPLRVDALRTGEETCTWQVPSLSIGFAVAAGTLRASGDTLRLTANGVRATPVRPSSSDSAPSSP